MMQSLFRKQMQRVSILLPMYNSELTIKSAVDSVIKQTFSELELIVIDDCSTDHSPELAESFDDPRIRILKLPKNNGVAHALNQGIIHSKGEIIGLIGSDDVYQIEKIQEQVSAMAERDVVCHSDGYTIGEGDRITKFGGINKLKDGDPLIETLKHTDALMPKASMMFRRDSAIEVGMFDESLFVREDTDFLLKMAAKKRFIYVPKALYGFRTNPESLMRSANRERRAQSYRILQQILEKHIKANRDRIPDLEMPEILEQLTMACVAGRNYSKLFSSPEVFRVALRRVFR